MVPTESGSLSLCMSLTSVACLRHKPLLYEGPNFLLLTFSQKETCFSVYLDQQVALFSGKAKNMLSLKDESPNPPSARLIGLLQMCLEIILYFASLVNLIPEQLPRGSRRDDT